ncbi:MAG: 4-(cytidine 5'-diphospho)-2-C-methyl-D-erythritol kinase [Acidobacteriota bacterium]|nr:4-(cytidine 5'-diphospho)-2-C-methyl-D-erythritol kinase [Acidobacteriota bacterium]
MATRVRSFSKINLGLAIGPVRADGFHGLVTLYQTLALHDVVTVEARLLEPENAEWDHDRGPSGQDEEETNTGILRSAQNDKLERSVRITLTTNHPGVPTNSRNTAWKMVERALIRMGVGAEVKIHIQKELPVQGGLGAGSANAAAALIGLERELGFTLSELARMELAAEVGSDVPLFLLGGAVLGTERGERVMEMPDFPATWCVVAVPEVGVSTPRAFQEWDERHGREQGTESGGLTSASRPDRLEQLSHVYATVFGAQTSDTSGIVRGRQDSIDSETKQGGLEGIRFTSEQGSALNGLAGNTLLALVRTGIENDFEQVVFLQYPLLREIKRLLMGTPAGEAPIGLFTDPARPDDLRGNALYAALSGSGSALFGLYRLETDARAAQQRVQSSGCKAILTETLPRAEYWVRMFAE